MTAPTHATPPVPPVSPLTDRSPRAVVRRGAANGTLAGLLVGAVAGTLVFPLIGTIIGLIVGTVIGLVLGTLNGAVLAAVADELGTRRRAAWFTAILATATGCPVPVLLHLDFWPGFVPGFALACGVIGAVVGPRVALGHRQW